MSLVLRPGDEDGQRRMAFIAGTLPVECRAAWMLDVSLKAVINVWAIP